MRGGPPPHPARAVRASERAAARAALRRARPLDIIYRCDPRHSVAPTRPATAAAARRVLEAGNARFARLLDLATGPGPRSAQVIPLDLRDLGRGEVTGRAPEQAPFAAVLGCADARVPVELVLQQGPGDLFVVRVAGGVLGGECLGSLHYAAESFPDTLRIVAVLGHAHCGAVSAAVDAFLWPPRYLRLAGNTSLRSIVDRILACVRGAALALEQVHGPRVGRRAGYESALIEVSVALNAAWTAYSLRQELREKRLGVVFGVYDLVSRRVRLPLSTPDALTPAEIGFLPPPRDAAGFRALSRRLAASAFVRSLLAPPLGRSV